MENKKLKVYFSLVILIIICLIVYGLYALLYRNDSVILDSSKDIVYTSYENEEYNQKIPNINIKKLSTQINNSIEEFTKEYKDVKTVTISYHYQVNGNILSLFITVQDHQYEGAPDVSFKSYIVNLKKLKLLSDDEVLELFDLDKETITRAIDTRFKEYYQDEITKKVISSDMTYQEYIEKRGLSDLGSNLYLDIKDSKLNVYVDYNAFIAEERQYYLAKVGYIFEFD